ncbi:hypothetical protein GCM10010521_64510 [Streptomyces rameus]|uniref:non-specific serine/threonine protein kinase n=1 Tax=Streptomyces rameus TaxID=68261 RepID=A0ABN3V3I1_9ACTN
MTEDGELPPDERLIGGRYRLAGRLGSGPAGTVWRARDEQEQVHVAVKEPSLPGDPADDEESRRIAHRLHREARTATRIRHPSAVTVYDVVSEAGVPWIVMELVEGESLREVLGRGALPPAEAARIALAVLGALRAAHAVGIVHRDVKPANVLLESGTGRVVLTDFGIGDGHAQDAPAGFVAPERAAGPGAGPASDLWSLGALLRSALGDAGPGPLGPLLDGLRADEPEARPGAHEVDVTLREYLGLEPVPDGPASLHPEASPHPEPDAHPEPHTGSHPYPESHPHPESDPYPGPRPDPEPDAHPEPRPDPEPHPESHPGPYPADPRRRTPLAALGLLLAKKLGTE